MKSKLTILALILLAATSTAFTQNIDHAPTADQCRADIAVWTAQSRADIVSLPVRTLLQRADYLSSCKNVLSDRDGVEWALTLKGIYNEHIVSRALNFIDRNGLSHQFYDEDAKGVR
jgi:hypothetical protein